MKAFSIFSILAFVLSAISTQAVVTPNNFQFATTNNRSLVDFNGITLAIALQNNSFNYVPAQGYTFNGYFFQNFSTPGSQEFVIDWAENATNVSTANAQIFEFNGVGSDAGLNNITVKSSIIYAGNNEATNIYGHDGANVPAGRYAVAIQVNNANFTSDELRVFTLNTAANIIPNFIDYAVSNSNEGIHGTFGFLANNQSLPFSFKVDTNTFVTFPNGTNAKNATNLTNPTDVSGIAPGVIVANLYPGANFFGSNGSAMLLFHIEASAFMAQINFVLLAVATMAVIYIAA